MLHRLLHRILILNVHRDHLIQILPFRLNHLGYDQNHHSY